MYTLGATKNCAAAASTAVALPSKRIYTSSVSRKYERFAKIHFDFVARLFPVDYDVMCPLLGQLCQGLFTAWADEVGLCLSGDSNELDAPNHMKQVFSVPITMKRRKYMCAFGKEAVYVYIVLSRVSVFPPPFEIACQP